MTEAAYPIENDDYNADEVDDELPTNHLQTSNLRLVAIDEPAQEEPGSIDWLARLTGNSSTTQALPDEPPYPQPVPSGMSQHIAPPRIAPTLGARVSTGLRRGTLLIFLLGLAAAALAGGAYVVTLTGWLANPFTQVSQTQPPDPSAGASSDSSTSQFDTQVITGSTDVAKLRDDGIREYKAGNFDQAIASLERAVALDGNDSVAHYQLGLAYMAVTGREHSLEDAEMAFRSAISLQPNWAPSYRMLAESLVRRGFYEAAIEPALEATKLDPNSPDVWMTLGRAYEGAGKQAEATQAFAQAARLSPAPPIKP
jgi:tetratricopeptide (TPR) repeat protein